MEQFAPPVRALHAVHPSPGLLYRRAWAGLGGKPQTHLGPRVSIVDHEGKLLARIGDPHPGLGPTQFLGPHGMAVDSRGDVYVGEVAWTLWPGLFPNEPRPEPMRTLRKFEKVR